MRLKQLAGLSAAMMCSTSLVFAQSAPANVNLVFIVDESGSMAGEHAFLGSVATGIEASLSDAGVSQVRYGLTGYGSSTNVAGHLFDVGGNTFGTATEFATATSLLEISGGTEDGYSGIDLALNSYDLSSGATTFVLVTDEDRDVVNSTLTFDTIRQALADAGISLVVVVNATLTDTDGNQAIATDGDIALIQSGTSFTVAEYDGVSSAAGTTEVDYIDLALASQSGCVADLNVLRNGGDSATAFSEVFVACLTEAAIVEVVTETGQTVKVPLENFAQVAMSILSNHNGAIRGIVFVSPDGAVAPAVTQNQSIIDNMFGIEGLRGYTVINGYTGSIDGSNGNAGSDYTGGGIIVGSDMTFDLIDRGTLRVGANIGWSQTNADESGSDSSFDQDGYSIGLYGGFWSDRGWYTLGTLQYGAYDMENRRVEDDGTAFVANPESVNWTGELEAGYVFQPAMPVVTALTPFVGVGFLETSISDFDENNGGISVDDYSQFTHYGKLGLRAMADQPFGASTMYGALELAAMIPFGDDDTLVQLSDGSATVLEAEEDTQYGLTLEWGMRFSDRGQLFAQYNGLYTDLLVQHGVTLGLSYQF